MVFKALQGKLLRFKGEIAHPLDKSQHYCIGSDLNCSGLHQFQRVTTLSLLACHRYTHTIILKHFKNPQRFHKGREKKLVLSILQILLQRNLGAGVGSSIGWQSKGADTAESQTAPASILIAFPIITIPLLGRTYQKFHCLSFNTEVDTSSVYMYMYTHTYLPI